MCLQVVGTHCHCTGMCSTCPGPADPANDLQLPEVKTILARTCDVERDKNTRVDTCPRLHPLFITKRLHNVATECKAVSKRMSIVMLWCAIDTCPAFRSAASNTTVPRRLPIPSRKCTTKRSDELFHYSYTNKEVSLYFIRLTKLFVSRPDPSSS